MEGKEGGVRELTGFDSCLCCWRSLCDSENVKSFIGRSETCVR